MQVAQNMAVANSLAWRKQEDKFSGRNIP